MKKKSTIFSKHVLYKGVIIYFFISAFQLHAQPWFASSLKSTHEKPGFEEVQKNFELYWETHSIEKGKGWKQFKRWEAFMTPRLYPNLNELPSKYYNKIFLTDNKKRGGITPVWEQVGPTYAPSGILYDAISGNGRVNCITFHPTNPKVAWVGAPSGGLWKTNDGGLYWTMVSDKFPCIGISAIVVNPHNTNEIYIATGDGDAGDTYSIGILYSSDGGKNFVPTNVSFEQSENVLVRKLVVDPDDPATMYATTSNGLYWTDDSWASSHSTMPGVHCKDLEIDPDNSDIIYICSYSDYGKALIYKSTDRGLHFSLSASEIELGSDAGRIEIAIAPSNTNILYAVVANASNGGFNAFYKSSDKGETWLKVNQFYEKNILGWEIDGSDAGGQGWYDLDIVVNPADADIVLVGGVNVWKTTNGGKRWNISSDWMGYLPNKFVHADIHHLSFDSSGVLWAGTDGGISKSDDSGDTWNDFSNGLGITQVIRVGANMNASDIVFGSQDNGSALYTDNKWQWILEGDGMDCFIDPHNNKNIYAEYYYGELMKSIDGGKHFQGITPPAEANPFNGGWITPFIMDPVVPTILYAGYYYLYKSVDAGMNWKRISGEFDSNNQIDVISVAPSNTAVIYIAVKGAIWKTKNGGVSWDSISSGLPDLAITDIAISDTDPNKIWISLSGYEAANKVYASFDGGETWSNYSTGLPNLPVNTIEYENGSQKALYIGTDAGIYYINAGLGEWVNITANMPNVIVSDILFAYDSKEVVVGTYGRGVWKTGIVKDSSSLYFVDFSSNYTQICADENITVNFTDKSVGEFDSYSWSFGEDAVPASMTGKGPHEVSFPIAGKHAVSLTVTKNDLTLQEAKFEYITSVAELKISIEPGLVYTCGNEVELRLNAIGEKIWRINGVDSIIGTGDTLRYKVSKISDVSVALTQGSCNATDTTTVTHAADNVCDAELLSIRNYFNLSNSCGTKEENEPIPDTLVANSCQTQNSWCPENGVQHSVWFEIDMSTSNKLHVEVPGFDNQIALYEAESCADIVSGNADKYSIVAANDDYEAKDNSAQLESVTNFNKDKRYWLQVDGSNYGITGIFDLLLSNTVPLIARFSSDRTFINAEESIRFIDESVGEIAEWKWYFAGAIPEYSTQQNPEVVYNEPGTYEVQLIISGNGKTDTIMKPYYVSVVDRTFYCDTLMNYTSGDTIYMLDDGGYISGTNSLQDNAKAEYYANNDRSQLMIYGMIVDFHKVVGNDDENIEFRIWNDVGGYPDNTLKSAFQPVSKLANDVFTGTVSLVTFETPVITSNAFYAGVVLPTALGDELAIHMALSDSVTQNTAWEQFSTGQWFKVSDHAINNHSFNIYPLVCNPRDDLSEIVLFPNPTKSILNIDFKTYRGDIKQIEILSLLGERVVLIDNVGKITDRYYSVSAAKKIRAGVYLLRIETDEKIISQKFIKIK